MKLFKIIGLILVLSPVVQVFGAAAGAFSEEIAAKSIKEDIKKPDDPMLFLAKHPDLNLSFYFLGLHHAMQYDDLPAWCKAIVEESDVLFHEGRHGVVFVEPFRTKYALRAPNNNDYYNWLEKLDSDEQATAQQIVDHFFKIVRCQKVDIPKIAQVRFWAIFELVQHFDYFAKDNAIDPTIHHLFLSKNKRVIDLDPHSLDERIREKLRDEELRDEEWCKTGKLDAMSYFKELLAEIKIFFETGEYPFESEEEELANLRGMQNFPHILAFANEYFKSSKYPDSPGWYQEHIGDRNARWLQIKWNYLKAHSNEDHQLLEISGAAHLPDMFARFIRKGFTISEVSESERKPLSEATKQMILGFEQEIRTYFSVLKSLKFAALGLSTDMFCWQREMLLTQQMQRWKKDFARKHPNREGDALALVPYAKPNI